MGNPMYFIYKNLNKFLGKHWELHRKALGPAFHPNILNGFTETIIQHVNVFMERLQALHGRSVEVSEYLFPCLMDIIIGEEMFPSYFF